MPRQSRRDQAAFANLSPKTDCHRRGKIRAGPLCWLGRSPASFQPGDRLAGENQELASLLSEEEFRAARATTLNAHYTSGTVIRGMYAALERLGFKHGRILEPACGIGHFIGFMPENAVAFRHYGRRD